MIEETANGRFRVRALSSGSPAELAVDADDRAGAGRYGEVATELEAKRAVTGAGTRYAATAVQRMIAKA